MVDELQRPPRTRHQCFADGACHLTTDGDLEQLHDFAERLGLKRAWFQPHPLHPHYDLTATKRLKALALGAVFVPAREQAAARLRARGALPPAKKMQNRPPAAGVFPEAATYEETSLQREYPAGWSPGDLPEPAATAVRSEPMLARIAAGLSEHALHGQSGTVVNRGRKAGIEYLTHRAQQAVIAAAWAKAHEISPAEAGQRGERDGKKEMDEERAAPVGDGTLCG